MCRHEVLRTVGVPVEPNSQFVQSSAPFYKCDGCGEVMVLALTVTINPTYMRSLLDAMEKKP